MPPLQVLQTLYILIQNLRSQTALYYVCSNNHVNDLVVLAFDFEDEEVLGYYINLLKSISLRLTPKTAQFFFMVGWTPPPPTPHPQDRPIFLVVGWTPPPPLSVGRGGGIHKLQKVADSGPYVTSHLG